MMRPQREAVFVAGYPRSGTTLLYRVLTRCPEFGGIDRSDTDKAFETGLSAYTNPSLDFAAVYRQVWPHWRELVSEDELTQVMRRYATPGVMRERIEAALTRHVFRDGAVAAAPGDVDSLAVRGWWGAASARRRRWAMRISWRRRLIGDLTAVLATSSGGTRLLDKFPFHYERYVELSVALPDARFVHVYRHPLDVFASMVRRARLELTERIPMAKAAWLVLSAEAFAHDWLRAHRAATEFAALEPSRILTVCYEDLTNEPNSQLHRIAAFTEATLPTDVDIDTPRRDPTRRFPLTGAHPVPNSGLHRDCLHDADIETILRRCAPVLTELGYQS